MQTPPLPPPPGADARAPSAALPYAVAAVSCAVLVAVAAIAFLRPGDGRLAIEDVIVLDAAAPAPRNQAESAPSDEPVAGDVLEADITGEGSSGDGMAEVNGLAVYVRGARRGERARFRILQVRTSRKGNRYATAEVVAPAAEGAP